MIIKFSHVRAAKRTCANGVELFFKRYGLDFEDFVINGIEEEKLIATGDGNALRVIEVAHEIERRKNIRIV